MELHVVEPPLPKSYVVFLPVIAGPYPGAPDEAETRRRIERIMDEGPDFFLDLTQLGELEPYAHLLPLQARHVRVPLVRGCVPQPARMREIVDTIDRARSDGWFLYVHDAEGIGRVGTAMGCWLADMEILERDPLDFLDEVRSEVPGPRQPSPVSLEQRAFVRGWTRGKAPRPVQEIAAQARAAGAWVGGELIDGPDWAQRATEGGTA